MKKILLSGAMLSVMLFSAYSVTHVITNSGYTFNPDSIAINLGDTVVFNLGSIHNAVEVSEATYLANGNTSNGGFSLPFGGGTVVLGTTGIHYYVCQPHASMGMKGIINVLSSTALNSYTGNPLSLNVFPNPASNTIFITYFLDRSSTVNIEVINVAGQKVAELLYGPQTNGQHEESFNLEGLNPGLYFVALKTGTIQTLNKLVIK